MFFASRFVFIILFLFSGMAFSAEPLSLDAAVIDTEKEEIEPGIETNKFVSKHIMNIIRS